MSILWKLVILVVASVLLAFLTRRSLTGFRRHGLYRLVAWIAAIALVLFNVDVWFDNPFEPHQLLSWLLLILSGYIAAYGYISLSKGRPDDSRNDDSLIGLEKTTELVSVGAYRHIRHPMYASFIYGALGVFLKDASLMAGVLTGIVVIFAVLTAKMEEAENIKFFGDTYRDYMKRTRMFIPYLW